MSEWVKKTLKEAPIKIIDGDRGHNYPKKTEFKKEGYCVFLNTGNVTLRGFDFSFVDFVSKESDLSLKKGKLKRGDIVLTTRGTVGNVAFFDDGVKYNEIRINSGMVILRVDPNQIHPYYLFIFLRSYLFKKRVLNQGSGSAQPQLPISSLMNIVFPWKNFSSQTKIAKVLSDLDAKIELNNKINAELEAIAKLIYDYWFVQFDFPDQNGNPYKSSGGKMVYNEELKRNIPGEWELKKLGMIGEFKNGVNYDPAAPGKVACPIINVRNISASSYFLDSDDLDIIYLDENHVRKFSVSKDDIIIARSSLPGATRLISNCETNTLYCGFAIRYQLDEILRKNQIFFYLKSIEKFISKSSGGTIQQNVNQEILKEFTICCPKDSKIIKTFNSQIELIFNKIVLIQKQNRKLTELRNWLLPMLMNGQVSVK